MWRKLVLISITSLMEQYNAQIHCKDIHQHVVSQGLHYIPGTNPCTLCVCDKGGPKWCKSVLCAPPQNCKSFQVGTLCCEFKCLDDILTPQDDTYDVALRFIASAVTAILSLSLLFFLFHRLKRRKILVHQNQQLNEDQRSLNSMGYMAGSLGYLPESMGYLGSSNNELEFHYEESNPHYTLWKPPGNYFPRGEAPPPYEEAVRTAQLEKNLINTQIRLANSLSTTLTVPANRREQSTPCPHECTQSNNNAQYANAIVQNVTVHNPDESAPKSEEFKHKIANPKSRTYTSKNTSKNSAVKSYENVSLPNLKTKRDRPTSSGYKNQRLEKHEYSNFNHPAKSSRYNVVDNSKSETRNNLYDELNYYENTGRHVLNVPETFNLSLFKNATQYRDASTKLMHLRKSKTSSKETPLHRTLPKNVRELLEKTEITRNQVEPVKKSHCSSNSTYNISFSGGPSKSHNNLNETCLKLENAAAASTNSDATKKGTNADEDKSFVSYQCLSSSQDDDDYRSECENCKSSGFTIPDDEETDVLNETMTLQRRPVENGEEVSYYRTSLTLPTNTRKSRAVVTNSNRESWFTSMQETSSSEEYD